MKKLDIQHKDLYSDEAQRYDERRFESRRGQLCHQYEAQSIVRLLSPLSEKRVLDLPTGTGRIAEELIRAGAKVTAADLTPAMLTVARRRFSNLEIRPTYTLVNANGRRLPFPDHRFDAVISIRFLHLIPPGDWPEFLSEMRRVAKPDGQVLVQIFNPFYGGPLALLREGIRHAKGEPGEQFVWPHQIEDVFKSAGLQVSTISSYWLPGMSLVGRFASTLLDPLSRVCETQPLKWIAGPHHVVAHAA